MEPCGETADSFSTDAIREEVKDVKASDLPTHEMIVAIQRCGEIAEEKLSQLVSDKEWLELDERSRRGAVPGSGKKVTRLLERQIARYEDEAAPYLDHVRRGTRGLLVSRLTKVILPAHEAVVGHHRDKAMKRFKQELEDIAADGVDTFAESVRQLKATAVAEYDEDCRDADASILQAEWGEFRAQFQSSQFQRDLDRHIASVQAEKNSQIASEFEKQLEDAVRKSFAILLEAGYADSWLSVRKLLSDESELAAKGLAATLRGFELDKEEETYLVSKLRNCGRNALRRKAEFEAWRALFRMKCRFTSVLWGPVSNSRTSTGDKDVRETVKDAGFEGAGSVGCDSSGRQHHG